MKSRTRIQIALVFIACIFACPNVVAGDDAVDHWYPESMDGLYERIAEDLKAGKPLIVTSYVGMWYKRDGDPERNLNWGSRDGHYTMLKRARKHGHTRESYRHHKWEQVLFEKHEEDPLRIAVFHHNVTPRKAWQELGVTEPFDMYLVMFAYQIREQAGLDMGRNLFAGKAQTLTLDDGTDLDLSQSQVMGYMGHNFFYDFEDFEYEPLTSLRKPLERATGLFAIGCKTGEVPGFLNLLDKNVHVVLFTHDFMAVEGHATLSLLEGLARKFSGKQIARLANRTYRSFRRLYDPESTPGRHYWSHDWGLFD